MDTGQLMTVGEGILQRTAIKSVKKGTRGAPGELIGTFQEKNKIGRLLRNDNSGIYGVLEKEFLQSYQGKEIEIALRNEIKPGPAQILANIDGEKIETFSIEILKLNASGKNDNKNMMIRGTDPGLLRRTGGIVQGMSGSPIIQNGKLVGAVTHVLINDPTRGYAIFIENMLISVQNLSITGAPAPLSTATTWNRLICAPTF
jgi:stage IV sporulation protein B